MSMHVDSKRIRAEREQRAWSQEHLASAAGVSLRTIQRVEGTGLASYDTTQALAAVFGVEITQLRAAAPVAAEATIIPAFESASAEASPAAADPQVSHRRRYWGLAASLALVIAAFFGRAAYAQQHVQLDVGVAINGRESGTQQLVAGEGKDAEIRLEGQLKLIVVPTVADDGNIALSIRMYEFAANHYALVSEPKLLAADNDRVEIELTSKHGNVFRVAIKPHKVDSAAPSADPPAG